MSADESEFRPPYSDSSRDEGVSLQEPVITITVSDSIYWVGKGACVISTTLPQLIEILERAATPLYPSSTGIAYWLRRDTLSEKEGLMLLLGLDPKGTIIGPSNFINARNERINEIEQAYFLDGREINFAIWHAVLGHLKSHRYSSIDDGLAEKVKCEIWQLSESYREMEAIWESGNHPARNTLEYFVEWANSKGFKVPWLEWFRLARDLSERGGCAEILSHDFLSLTGSKLGISGQYHIEENGVTARLLTDMSGSTSEEAATFQEFMRNAKLDFPTTALGLVEWVERQGGQFVLPDGFIATATVEYGGHSTAGATTKVPTKAEPDENQAAVVNSKAKGGRPKIIDKKAYAVRKIIEQFEKTASHKFDSSDLPGSASDLLEACQRIERAITTKCVVFSITEETFKTWLKAAGYGFSPGRTLNSEEKYWTHLCVETIPLITPEIFTDVYDKTTL